MSRNFFLELTLTILESVNNEYRDNFDFARFDNETVSSNNKLKSTVKRIIGKYGYYNNGYLLKQYFEEIKANYSDYSGYEYLYNNLETKASKELLVRVIAFRLMGHRKIKLPLNNAKYMSMYDNVVGLRVKEIEYPSLNNALKLFEHDLNELGYSLKLILSSYGVLIDFIHEQYKFEEDDIIIQAENGDFVIDGGGCYGDTALYFSYLVGLMGKVFSFEFVPSNLEIFCQNLENNARFSESIVIEKKPLADISGKPIYFSDRGPASRVSEKNENGFEGQTQTVSIDEYMLKNSINKVDFIKLDIEGSEILALKGAIQTIQKYKPKLAIALYHSPSDFFEIPNFIKQIVPDYKFYLKHATINSEETMLFCIAKSRKP